MVCLNCLINYHNHVCGNASHEIKSLCFIAKELKNIVFPECNTCESRYKCFTEKTETDK